MCKPWLKVLFLLLSLCMLRKDPHVLDDDIEEVSDVAMCKDPAAQVMMHCLSQIETSADALCMSF